MATLAPVNTPARQPFGVLNDAHLRSLQSIKNRQNAITPNSAPNLKRRAPSPELSDAENVDPNVFDSMNKRKRAAYDGDVSLSKPSRYNLHVLPSPKPYVATPTVTPRLDIAQKSTITPLSAPAAAGRSPTKGKRMGLMQPRKRFAPPSLGSKSPSLSITAALKGTLAHKKAKKLRTIEESKPKSWFFDIFEESEEQQDYRMNEWSMTQSAVILDISDDEGKLKEETDRGKENMDPNSLFAAPSAPGAAVGQEPSMPKMSRKDAMSDEPRTPLGDLNPAQFYADGLDATSVVLVHEDSEAPLEPPATVEAKTETDSRTDFTFESNDKLPATGLVEHDIHTLLATSKPNWEALQPTCPEPTEGCLEIASTNSIEIWESESAKDEEERVEAKFDESEVFALQEL